MKNKQWVNSKKPVFDNVVFDSTSELTTYKMLKEAGIKFTYTEKSRRMYTLLEKFQYQGGSFERSQKRSKKLSSKINVLGITYTPDFIGENEEWFIEVKGRKLPGFNLRWKLFKKLLENRDPQPMLFMPVTTGDIQQVVNILIDKGYGEK